MGMRATIPITRPISSLLPLLLCSGAAWAQTWSETAAELERLAGAGEYAEAAALGPELLERATEEFGESSQELADSYVLLARAELASGETAAAERSVLNALTIVRREQGPATIALVEPLVVIGETYQAAGAHDAALAAFTEAQGIVRRTFGLSNPGEADILQRMAEALGAMGDVEEALDLQREAIGLLNSAYGSSSRQTLDAIRRFGDWLASLGYGRQAADQYAFVGRALIDGTPDEQVEGVRLLMRAAEMQRVSTPADDRPFVPQPTLLQFALEAVQQLPTAMPLLHAEILRDLGDWAVVFGAGEQAQRSYTEAWRLLEGGVELTEARSEWFGEPVPLRMPALRSRARSAAAESPEGFIELEFTVETNGTTNDVAVVAAEPPGLIDRDAIRRIENARFRPKLEAGRVVASTHTLRFDFSGFARR